MTITFDHDIDTNGSSLLGMFKSPWSFAETVARLITLSGLPLLSQDQDKTSFEYTVRFAGSVFTLYAYKEDMEIHIGGFNNRLLQAFNEALLQELAEVQPTPYRNRTFYGDNIEYGWPEQVEPASDTLSLSNDDRNFIANALRLAATVYEQDASKMSDLNQTSLSDQFSYQADKARTLAARMDL